jgi:hypothetical protein
MTYVSTATATETATQTEVYQETGLVDCLSTVCSALSTVECFSDTLVVQEHLAMAMEQLQ